MDHTLILLTLAAVFALEFAAFGMQRCLLLLAREKQAPYDFVALLLPTWFPAVWILRIVKWGLLFYTALFWSWLMALGLLLVDFLLSALVPIPYRAYRSILRARAKQIGQVDERAAQELSRILADSKVLGT